MKRNNELSGVAIVGCVSCSLALTMAIFFMLPWLSVPLVAGLTIISIGMGLYDWALTAAFFLAMWVALSGATIVRMKFGKRTGTPSCKHKNIHFEGRGGLEDVGILAYVCDECQKELCYAQVYANTKVKHKNLSLRKRTLFGDMHYGCSSCCSKENVLHISSTGSLVSLNI